MDDDYDYDDQDVFYHDLSMRFFSRRYPVMAGGGVKCIQQFIWIILID